MIKYNFKNKNTVIILTIAAAFFLVSLIVWVNVDIFNKIKAIGNAPAANTITVSATSEVYAKPDLALTTFSVLSEAKTVSEAMQDNSTKMNAITAFVKNQEIEDKDIKTVNFSISPRYEWREETGERILAGYEVSQSLQVKIRDLAKVGDIIQGATAAGANNVGDLQFTIDKEDVLKDEANAEAIKEAKNKAKVLAEKLGIRLVKIISFSESADFPVPYYAVPAKEALSGKGASDIQPGENKISATVSLTYQIR